MPAALPSTLTIITSALRKLFVIGAAESAPGGEDTEYALSEYNQLLGQFNVRERKAYREYFQNFTFTTSLTSYSLGVTADSPNFVITAGNGGRPARINRAQLVLVSGTPDSYLEIPVYNWPDYTLLSLPGIASTYPMAIFYDPTVPNGTIHPYPTSPTDVSNQLRLWWWQQLETVHIDDISASLNLPPGLERALVTTLAVNLYPGYAKRTDLEELKRQQRWAMSDFESQNRPPVKISSDDGIQGHGAFFDYRTRTWQS